ncbi:hypothetical protein KC352_g21318 [Hortaea werneckii]|uniref:DASH complex subunit DAM1 n=1 Tax=Hortaea werneckii TaxID=91943 RepID=A0A3M7HW27_HORWE|nr:hypothetical protein KC352_g21318 [Hortaea werneckii]RMZ17379.1 hypothetical protein D0860_00529 [Hortaea werneckii]RMZ28775.1 hypothetical protein D0859_07158 [Hortaea werneckii]
MEHHYSPLKDADKSRPPYTIPLNDFAANPDGNMAATATPASQHRRHERTSSHSRTRSGSRNRLPSRPTTPLRPPSRTSLRASQTTPSGNAASLSSSDFPLASLEPQFAELSDSMADLEANFMHLQLLNESIARFNEDFGGFLYGMNMSAFCIDFPEAPIPQSFARHKDSSAPASSQTFPESPFQPRTSAHGGDADATFLTTDTSFVENPPTSSKPASKYSAPPSGAGGASERRSTVAGRARGRAGGTAATRGTRGGAAAGRGTATAGRATRGGRGAFR